MTKSKLYIGDSSEEEDIHYSKKKIIENLVKIQKEKQSLLSSFILEEIAQSILEDNKVVESYKSKKNNVAQKKSITNILDSDIYTDTFLFGKHLIYKNSKNENHKELEQFYEKNRNKIEGFKKKATISDNLYLFKDEVERCIVKDFNFEKVQNLLSKYFSKSSVQNAVESYFRKVTFDKIKESILKGNVLQLSLSPTGKATLEGKNQEELKNFFQNEFPSVYLNNLLQEVKQNNKGLQKFLTHFLSRADSQLVESYVHYKEDLFKTLTCKKVLPPERYLNLKDAFITKLYIDYLNIEYNKKINNVLLQLRPNKFFLEDSAEFFANFKLDHKIMRSKSKENGIGKYDKTLVHNTRIGEQLSDELSEYQTSERNNIYSTGARSDFVFFNDNEASYDDITTELSSWSISAKDIVRQIRQILKTGVASIEDTSQKEYLYELTYLLFRYEPERNVSAFLTNAMFLELLETAVYNIEDLPRKLPMGIKRDENNNHGAVPAARYILDLLGGKYGEQSPYLTKRQHYDFGKGDEEKALELAARDTIILLDWLFSKNILIVDYKIKYEKKFFIQNECILQKEINFSEVYIEFQQLQSENNKFKQTNLINLISATGQYIFELFGANGGKIFQILYGLVEEWYEIKLDYLLVKTSDEDTKMEIELNIISNPKINEDISDKINQNKTVSNFLNKKTIKLLTIESEYVVKALDSLATIIHNELIPKLHRDINSWENGWYTDTMQQLLLRSYNQNCVVHEKINTIEIATISALVDSFTKAELFKGVSGTLEKKIADIKQCLFSKYVFLNTKDINSLDEITFNSISEEDIKEIDKLLNSIKVGYKSSEIKYPGYVKESNQKKFESIYKLKNTIYDSLKNEDMSLSQEIGKFLLSTKSHMIIPINITNIHWTAFVINKSKDILYIDTNAAKINKDSNLDIILQEIKGSLGSGQNVTYVFDKKVQYDGYNCGPFMIEVVSRVIAGKTLDDFEVVKNYQSSEELGDNIRVIHKSLLESSEIVSKLKEIPELDTSIFEVDQNVNEKEKLKNELIQLLKNNKLSSEELSKLVEEAKKEALKGLDEKEDTDIDWINSYFSKYTLDGLDNILDLRLKNLELKDIKTLSGIFIDQEHNNIIELLSNVIHAKVQTTLVPLNLFNKHAAGLIFEKTNDNSIQVKYLDPENKSLPDQLVQTFSKYNLHIEQLKVEQQKYANCGVEVIEDFIFYLTNERLSQEEAIPYHSYLLEQSLMYGNYEEMQLVGCGL